MSLRWKLAIAMGLLLAAMVALVSVGAYLTTDRRLHEEVDTSLDQRADALSFVVLLTLTAALLLMGMLGQSAFWMTNLLFLALTITGLTGVGLRLWLYRTGVAA